MKCKLSDYLHIKMGGGVTPLHELFRFVRPQRIEFSSQFGDKQEDL